MTLIKTALISTALIGATSSAAFAGEKHYDAKKDMQKTTVTTTAPTTEVMGAIETNTVTKANDTIGEVLQADGQPDTQDDYELLTHDGDMLTKSEAKMMDSDKTIANNAIVVPSSTGAITTVNCPIGTTAQPDMTCHVTGNYSAELTESLRTDADNMRATEMATDTRVLGAVSYDKQMKTTKDHSDMVKTEYKSDYKGTLRPDSLVTENVK